MSNSHKPNKAKKKSRILYNLSMRDVKNKERKLKRHKKDNKDVNMKIDVIMSNYAKHRKQGKTS